MSFQKPLPPPLSVGYYADPGAYSLAGWEEFERHMRINDPLYRVASDSYAMLQEAHRLKLLVAAMARRAIAQENQIARLLASYGAPVALVVEDQPRGNVPGIDAHQITRS